MGHFQTPGTKAIGEVVQKPGGLLRSKILESILQHGFQGAQIRILLRAFRPGNRCGYGRRATFFLLR